MNIDELLGRLQDVKPNGNGKWLARCPNGKAHSHNDKCRSFSIRLDSQTGNILTHCHTGCSFNDTCAALGCSPKDLMSDTAEADNRKQFLSWYADKNKLKLAAIYEYGYAPFSDGLAKIKFIDAEGKKTFVWLHYDDSTKSGFKMNHTDCPPRLYVAGRLDAAAVFMAEGEKDADTLHRITQRTAVCTEHGAQKGSDPGSKWHDEYAQQLKGKHVFLLWDNDTAGRDFAQMEAQKLKQAAEKVIPIDIKKLWPECPDKGDISDMAQALGDAETWQRLKAAIETESQKQEEQPKTEFELFMQAIQTEKYKPVRTGINEFDELLGGGILRQSLVMLTAAPGTGKTTIVQQWFETMAASGQDVIFLNLEMSREQLLARSMSRMIHKQGHNMPAADVLKGYAWTDYQREYVTRAALEYQNTIAPHMTYNPTGCTTDIESIRDTLNTAGTAAREAGKPGPVCVLDYLHLITTSNREEQAELIKKSVAMLKQYAIDYNTFVLAIGASNRASNSSGTQGLDSARDSSSIEYTADYQIALNYRALSEGQKKLNGDSYRASNPDDMEELAMQQPREMVIQILKNRMNAIGGKIYVNFDAANSTFEYAGKPQRRTAQKPIPAGFTRADDPDNPYL